MDKRYQVFVSSTYADLKEERQKVLQTLMEMDCIPSGMEMFPATDEEQWEFIKKIIDDCDYYLLIIGGRYGSTTDEGISYTEKEYDYAVEIGIKVIAFLHENPSEISVSKSDIDPEISKKLNKFRDKVSTGRLVKFWSNAAEIPGLVALSLTKTIKTHPAVGWVRATSATSAEVLSEINELRKENEQLRIEANQHNNANVVAIDNLADMEDTIELKGTYKVNYNGSSYDWKVDLSWNEIFSSISPYLIETPNDTVVKRKLRENALDKVKEKYYSCDLDDQVFQTIKIQLLALNLIKVDYSKTTKGNMALFWKITKKGQSLMMNLRTMKKEQA